MVLKTLKPSPSPSTRKNNNNKNKKKVFVTIYVHPAEKFVFIWAKKNPGLDMILVLLE